MSNQVDNYFKKLKSPQKEISERLRNLILKTFPKTKEEMKYGVPWYSGKFYIVALKDHVNLGFCWGGLLKKYEKELEGTGKYMRHIKFFSLKDIDEAKLVKMMGVTEKVDHED
jgi:hypothetical protein